MICSGLRKWRPAALERSGLFRVITRGAALEMASSFGAVVIIYYHHLSFVTLVSEVE